MTQKEQFIQEVGRQHESLVQLSILDPHISDLPLGARKRIAEQVPGHLVTLADTIKIKHRNLKATVLAARAQILQPKDWFYYAGPVFTEKETLNLIPPKFRKLA